MRGRCSLALRGWFIPSPPRLFQNNRRKWTRSEQAWPPSSARTLRRELCFVCREKIGCGCRPDCFLLGWGCQGTELLGARQEPAERAGRAERPRRREALTFQRKAAARVVLPRARPHHPGHSSGQRGHPEGSFFWKLYPGRGETERRVRCW